MSSYQWLAGACREWLRERAGESRSGESLTPPLDAPPWDDVERAAHVHGVESILYALVRRQSPFVSAAPLTLQQKWEQAYYSTRILNAEVMALVDAIVQAARAAVLPVLVIKGPAVLAAVYGDIGLRPMADLDLMCHTGDLPSFAAILRSLEFTAGSPYLHQLDFRRARDGKVVELHFDLHHGIGGAERFLAGAWSGSRTASLEEWTFPLMSAEHELVFELGHYVHHDFELPLKNVVDFSGWLALDERALDRRVLQELLNETGLAAAFEKLRAAPFEWPASFGLLRKRRTAGLFVRQRGFGRKVAFLRKRLFPPLEALQASRGLTSRTAARAHVPLYTARAVVELVFKLRAGF